MPYKAISAKVDENTLIYIKGCHEKVNTLINTLLKKWVKDRQNKELLLWKENTGQDELSLLKDKNDIKCNQSCKNCRFLETKYKRKCIKCQFFTPNINFCCIYWEKKKGSR